MFPGGDTTASTNQNPTVTYLNPGTYSVTLIVTNFFGSDTLFMPNYVTVYANPVISVSADQSICEGETAMLSAFGASIYSWSTGQTDSVIAVSPTVTTTYTVTGSSNGCGSQQEDIVVSVTTIPTTSITPDQNICFGDSLIITATGGNSYSWNTGDTTASITIGSSTPPATYTAVISKDACTDFDTISTTITTVQQPIADFVASDTLVELQNATIAFTNNSSSAIQFDWDMGDGSSSTSFNPIYTYLDTGWYAITLVADNPECEPDTLIKYNYIHVTPDLPVANFTSGADTVCSGDSVQFMDASLNSTAYDWNFNGGVPGTSTDQNPMVQYATSGTYNVTLISSGPGGSDTTSQLYTIEVRQMPVAAFSTIDTLLIQPNTTATFTNSSLNADSYSWDFGDGNNSSDVDPWNIYGQIGVYTVVLIAQSDYCPDDTVAMDSLVHVETGIGIDNAEIEDFQLRVYPNPTKGLIVLESSATVGTAEIYNTLGQMLLAKEITKETTLFDLSFYPAGVYFLSVSMNDYKATVKITLF